MAFAPRSVSASGRACVKTQQKSSPKKIDLSEYDVFNSFELGNGRRTPEIEQIRVAEAFSHRLGRSVTIAQPSLIVLCYKLWHYRNIFM